MGNQHGIEAKKGGQFMQALQIKERIIDYILKEKELKFLGDNVKKIVFAF